MRSSTWQRVTLLDQISHKIITKTSYLREFPTTMYSHCATRQSRVTFSIILHDSLGCWLLIATMKADILV